MKTKRFNAKLELNKKTLVNLNLDQLKNVKGMGTEDCNGMQSDPLEPWKCASDGDSCNQQHCLPAV